jgi:hypothetical protein
MEQDALTPSAGDGRRSTCVQFASGTAALVVSLVDPPALALTNPRDAHRGRRAAETEGAVGGVPGAAGRIVRLGLPGVNGPTAAGSVRHSPGRRRSSLRLPRCCAHDGDLPRTVTCSATKSSDVDSERGRSSVTPAVRRDILTAGCSIRTALPTATTVRIETATHGCQCWCQLFDNVLWLGTRLGTTSA